MHPVLGKSRPVDCRLWAIGTHKCKQTAKSFTGKISRRLSLFLLRILNAYHCNILLTMSMVICPLISVYRLKNNSYADQAVGSSPRNNTEVITIYGVRLRIHSFRRLPTSSGNCRLFPYTASTETSRPIRNDVNVESVNKTTGE